MEQGNNTVQPDTAETLYVEPGSRQCRILAIRGKLKPGQSLDNLPSAECKQVGLLDGREIVSLEKKYWPTADEQLLTPGMMLTVKNLPVTGHY